MQIQGLTKSQQKIIMIASIVGFISLAFLFFIFLPAHTNVEDMKTELAGIETQIKDIENKAGGARTLAEGIRRLELRNKELEAKFPEDMGESLNTIAQLVRDCHLKIISLKPSFSKALVEENDKEVEVEGKTCKTVFVTLNLKGTYHNFIKFRDIIQDHLPGFVVMEMMNIIHESQNEPQQLTIVLAFNLYLLN
ncbi:MAG: hypothetical protein HQL13_03015 [Candidatus Omnitrophica bacterium]|nr:hypothetical protein [Candidatus Omnitrophota bacterium]